ncbi:hypothetical protein [Corynebacterium sp. UBA2622]|uniref:hypothetical protein n=1 Tax=Corynebacterium sp. UBA2622 TaxID=1946393 RepID=UPI0025BC0F04|nr:hypothetical protein [Corynebacterium sp. UBA2622]
MTYHSPDPRKDRRPLPPEIYLRRRVAALVILLVLAILLVWGMTAAAKSGSQSGAGQTTSALENITTEPTVPVPGESTSSSTSGTATTTATSGTTSPSGSTTATTTPNAAADKKTCELTDLAITARTNAPSYASGEQPTFYMSVTNPTAADCTIDLSKDQLRFEVYDMATNQRVWSDTDCHPAVVTGEEKFLPNKARDFEAIWSRKDSAPGHCSSRADVPAGSYYLHAVIGDHASDPADFTLR